MIKKILLFILLIGVLSLVLIEGPVLAYIRWEVVLTPDTTPGHEWESGEVFLPYLMYDYQDNIYKMWYSCGGEGTGIGYATSIDGVNWGNRQLIEGVGPGYFRISTPWVIKSGGVYKIWHRHYYEWCGGEWSSYVNYCESPDGINWGPETYNFGCPGRTWEHHEINMGSVVQKDDSTFLYYHAATPSYTTAIGRAVSLDTGRTWINSTRTMIIYPDSVEFCDTYLYSPDNPNVTLKEDGTYRMYFWAYPSPYPYEPAHIYEGVSRDGLHWDPDSLRPFLAPYMLGDDISGVLRPFYFKDKDGKEYLYFQVSGKIGRALLNQIVNGDCNSDSTVDVADVVCIINYLFRNGSPSHPCMSADVNGDGIVDVGDIVYLINYLFRNGTKPLVGCAKNC